MFFAVEFEGLTPGDGAAPLGLGFPWPPGVGLGFSAGAVGAVAVWSAFCSCPGALPELPGVAPVEAGAVAGAGSGLPFPLPVPWPFAFPLPWPLPAAPVPANTSAAVTSTTTLMIRAVPVAIP